MKKLFNKIKNWQFPSCSSIILALIGYFLVWGIFLYVPDTIRANKLLNGQVVQYKVWNGETRHSNVYMIQTEEIIKLEIIVQKQIPFEREAKISIHAYDIKGAKYLNQNFILWFVKDDLLRKFN